MPTAMNPEVEGGLCDNCSDAGIVIARSFARVVRHRLAALIPSSLRASRRLEWAWSSSPTTARRNGSSPACQPTGIMVLMVTSLSLTRRCESQGASWQPFFHLLFLPPAVSIRLGLLRLREQGGMSRLRVLRTHPGKCCDGGVVITGPFVVSVVSVAMVGWSSLQWFSES